MRIRSLLVALLAAGAFVLPVQPAHAFLLDVRITVSGFPTALQVCATASTGLVPATDITLMLDLEGTYASVIGTRPIFDAPIRSVPNTTSVGLCSGTFDVSGSATTGAFHVGVVALASNGLATLGGTCQGEGNWSLGGGLVVVKGC